MTTGFASPEGLPSPRLIAWYGARGAGGTGLVTVEGALVAPAWRARLALPLQPAPAAPGRRRLRRAPTCPLTEAIHRAGARAARAADLSPGLRDTEAVWPSPAAEIAGRGPGLRHGRRAGRREAGFDAVEVQCTYRSLFAQLLSRATNRRRDRYGRGPGGRLRAVREALEAIRAQAGADFPVLVKYSADEYLPRGITPDGPGGRRRHRPGPGRGRGGGAGGARRGGGVRRPAALLRGRGRGGAGRAGAAGDQRGGGRCRWLVAGRLLTGDGAEAVLRQGQADLVTVGRAMLADPAWLAKTRAGVELEVIPCIGCMACYTPAPDGGIGCPVNGEAGQEHLPPLPAAAGAPPGGRARRQPGRRWRWPAWRRRGATR